MEKYLIDTNTAIDYLDNKLPKHFASLLESVTIYLSVIVRMELLSWKKATYNQEQILLKYINASFVYGLYEPIIVDAIFIRKNYSVKLPDAIIAATAINKNLILLTRNMADFEKINGLNVINPFT